MAETPLAPMVSDFARYRVDPEEGFRLQDSDPRDHDDMTREESRAELASLTDRIAELQARLYAEEQRAMLVVLQGIDAAGKDSTVKHVFRGSNPQGVRVYSFKEPTRGGVGARLPLALPRRRAADRDDSRVQPLALRGRAGRAREGPDRAGALALAL